MVEEHHEDGVELGAVGEVPARPEAPVVVPHSKGGTKDPRKHQKLVRDALEAIDSRTSSLSTFLEIQGTSRLQRFQQIIEQKQISEQPGIPEQDSWLRELPDDCDDISAALELVEYFDGDEVSKRSQRLRAEGYEDVASLREAFMYSSEWPRLPLPLRALASLRRKFGFDA